MEIKTCESCKKEFKHRDKRKKGRFCSRKCFGLKIRGKNSPSYKHGNAQSLIPRTKEYRTWAGMINRCNNNNVSGGSYYKKIEVCDRWKTFENFLKDMGKAPSDNHSIERVDVLKGYYPENCKWIPKGDQAKNTRRSKWVTYKGKTQILSDWARELDINLQTLHTRLSRGEDINKVFELPVRKVDRSLYTLKGKTQSLPKWAKEYGIKYQTLYWRINKSGKTLLEALNV